jgi:hypothetical protein
VVHEGALCLDAGPIKVCAPGEIGERWLAFTSIVFAPIHFAMNRSRSGSILRSSVDTTYQRGFDRQADMGIAACVGNLARRSAGNIAAEAVTGTLKLDSTLAISKHASVQAPSKLGLRPAQSTEAKVRFARPASNSAVVQRLPDIMYHIGELDGAKRVLPHVRERVDPF